MNSVNIGKARTSFEAKMESGKANSFKSPAEAEHESWLRRVLGTSARKPPLSDTLLWATLSLAHPFKIEVILSKRVDVLPKQRGCEAQNIVVDHLAFSAELADYIPDVQRIPSNDSVVQDRQTTERVDLIAELASPQRALLAKAEESRQVV